MRFQVEITPVAEAQIEQAYCWYRDRNPEFADRWFRGLMNAIATPQEKPQRCANFSDRPNQKNKARSLFSITSILH